MNKSVLIILFFCLSLSGFSQERKGDYFFELMANIENFHADFIQTNEHNGQTKTLTGWADFVVPTTLRWHQKQPFEQVILIKNDITWVYDIDLEQLTKRKTDPKSSLFAGLFNTQSLQKPVFLGTKNGLDWYQNKYQNSTASFGFKEQQLIQVHFTNNVYQSKIVLKNHRALTDKTLTINPPQGVSIIDYTK